ncbi:MAG: PilN domain-containing protein, partial [Syntrophales bacterium LBB04]|nr:PilN domain-containing protein [Syntrophales bacterium LBB04]
TADSALYDFRPLGAHDETLGVTVFAVRADRVTPYLHAMREKNISVDSVSISSCGLSTFCRYIDGEDDTVFIDVNDYGYEGGVISGGALIDAFSGRFNGGERSVNIARLVDEAGRAVGVLEREGKKPRLLLVSANTPHGDALKSRLSVPVNTPGDTNGRKLRIAEAGGTRVEAAIGSLLEPLWLNGARVNLMSRGRMTKKRTPAALTLLCVAFLVAVAAVYVVAPLKVEERRLQETERQIGLRKEEVRKVEVLKKELEGIEAETAGINGFKGDRAMMLAILKELTAILPRNVWLSRIRVAENRVELEGYAASSATEILARLEASAFFQKVEFSSPTQKDPRWNADRFAVRMELEGTAKDVRKGATGETKK